MKQCPQCERTYADETISFCLADGQLLSPSYGSAATLPLTPARVTDGAATLILPVALTPERARKIIRRNLIAGLVTLPIGFVGSLIAFSSQPSTDKPPLPVLVGIAAIAGLVYAYFVWAAFWGYPTVWRWWRNFARKIFKFVTSREFHGAVLVLAIILGLCLLGPALAAVFLYFYSLIWFGLAYSIFGGGIYQFLKTRKIARSDAVSES